MIESKEEKELTAQERDAEIARLQAEKAAAAGAQVEQENAARRQREELKETNTAEQFLAEAGRAGISWNIPADELRQLIGLVCVLRSSEDGKQLQALDKKTGQDIGIRKALELLAVGHQQLVKDNSAAHLLPQRAEDGTYRPLSKEDLTTWAQRSAYIEANGLQAFSDLPLKSTRGITTNIDKMTAEDVSRMTLTQRSELITKYGSEIYSQILSRRRKS